MGTIQQFGYNLYVLYNLCIIYIYNQVSIFLLNHRTSLKNLAAWCEMELSSMSQLLDILQNLYLWSQLVQRAPSRSFCSGSCLRFDVNIESNKLSGEGLFRDLYTSIISFWIFWWWIENNLFLLSRTSNDDS